MRTVRTESISSLKRQVADFLVEIERDRAPILITRRGLPSAYLVDVETFKLMQQRIGLLEGIVRGEEAVAQGRTVSHAQAKRRLLK